MLSFTWKMYEQLVVFSHKSFTVRSSCVFSRINLCIEWTISSLVNVPLLSSSYCHVYLNKEAGVQSSVAVTECSTYSFTIAVDRIDCLVAASSYEYGSFWVLQYYFLNIGNELWILQLASHQFTTLHVLNIFKQAPGMVNDSSSHEMAMSGTIAIGIKWFAVQQLRCCIWLAASINFKVSRPCDVFGAKRIWIFDNNGLCLWIAQSLFVGCFPGTGYGTQATLQCTCIGEGDVYKTIVFSCSVSASVGCVL